MTGIGGLPAARVVAALLFAALLVALFPGEAKACSCAQAITADIVDEAVLVFVGEEIARVDTNQQWPSVAVTFRVVEAYKGEVDSEITVFTGRGGGDCGVARLPGLVGIAVFGEAGKPTINSCGSVQEPQAVAAVLDPIALAEPPRAAGPSPAASGGAPWALLAATGLTALAVGGMIVRRRRSDWQDGWSGGD